MRTVFVILAGILAAAIIHIIAIFAVPIVAPNDLWHRSVELGEAQKFHLLDDMGKSDALFPNLDPAFAYGFCRADISSAPIHLSGRLASDFWSMSYIDAKGRSHFSLTNQISGPELNVVLATRGQQRLISEKPDLLKEGAVIITAKSDKGMLVLRNFISRMSEHKRIRDAMSKIECRALWPAEGK